MRTLLILTKQPPFAASIEAALDAEKFQFIAKENIWEAEVAAHSGRDRCRDS